eukprot:Clim_evm44s231 gene=Clim_evmTU44s231
MLGLYTITTVIQTLVDTDGDGEANTLNKIILGSILGLAIIWYQSSVEKPSTSIKSLEFDVKYQNSVPVKKIDVKDLKKPSVKELKTLSAKDDKVVRFERVNAKLDQTWGELVQWFDDPTFNESTTKNGTRVASKLVDDTGIPILRVKTLLPQYKPEEIINMLWNADTATTKIMEPDFLERNNLEQSENLTIAHQVIKTPMIIANRDNVCSLTRRQQGNTVAMVSRSCDDIYNGCPAGYKGCARATLIRGCFAARPASGGGSEIVRMVQSDAGGSIPKSLVSAMSAKWVAQVENLPKAMKANGY